jgi:methionyl-tRNA formyltransferase
MTRIVLFTAGGEFGSQAWNALRRQHDVLAVVKPATLGIRNRLRSWRRNDKTRAAVFRAVRRANIPLLKARPGSDSDLADRLAPLRPDVMCVAAFPYILSDVILGIPEVATLNVHASLLPRHRGPNPYFWTYYHGDREAGVTVHHVTASIDAGDIVAQDRFPLPRGYNIIPLHSDYARMGAKLLCDVLEALGRGHIDSRPQNEAVATAAPRVPTGTPQVPFTSWGVDQVWHLLRGMFPKFVEPLLCDGRPVSYRGVGAFRRTASDRRPGSVDRAPHGWTLFARDGSIELLSESHMDAE